MQELSRTKDAEGQATQAELQQVKQTIQRVAQLEDRLHARFEELTERVGRAHAAAVAEDPEFARKCEAATKAQAAEQAQQHVAAHRELQERQGAVLEERLSAQLQASMAQVQAAAEA